MQSALPQRGGEVNLTLGGIDLNNTGRYIWLLNTVYSLYSEDLVIVVILIFSVVVREDKKLLTVLFPDGRDGRAFTLKVLHLYLFFFKLDSFLTCIFLFPFNVAYLFKCVRCVSHFWLSCSKFQAETSEDLYEWKTALEHALSQAPSAALVIGHNRVFQSDTNEAVEGSFHQCLFFSTIKNYPFHFSPFLFFWNLEMIFTSASYVLTPMLALHLNRILIREG